MSIKTITSVPPIDFLSVGQPLSAWSISGNSQQNGTPTPDAPIYPEFVGDKTENLAPTISEDSGWRVGYLTNQGTYTNNNPRGEILSPMISLSGISSFTISASEYSVPSMSIYYFNGDTYISNQGSTDYSGSVFTSFPANATQFCFAIRTGYQTIGSVASHGWHVMVNTGSIALPYEPYGYKLPVSCAGQTVPIYLGQTQTVRKIKKLVLTGEETVVGFVSITGGCRVRVKSQEEPLDIINTSASVRICTHFVSDTNWATIGAFEVPADKIGFFMQLPDSVGLTSGNDFKQWLADQYANGTPVCIWYVLAEPETGIVNEPLCKIGDYADTVASTNTGAPSIPTSEGSNVLTIGTTVQPSEVSITYMAPNTIAENLQRLQIARTNIATAITTKGGTLVENAGFEDFPDAINNIPIESGGMPMAGITILLYDGSTFGDAGPTTIIEEGSI